MIIVCGSLPPLRCVEHHKITADLRTAQVFFGEKRKIFEIYPDFLVVFGGL